MAELVIKMLGTPSVLVDGRAVSFPYRKADALLYYMILRKRASRGELAGLLWADSDNAAAMKNLRHAIYSIRKCLGFDIFTPGQWTMLEVDPQLAIRCDVIDFLERGDLFAFQGEFLAGFSVQNAGLFENWLTEQRSLLHTDYLKKLLNAAKDASLRGDLATAEELGLEYVQRDPLEESVAVTLMELYSAQKKFRKAIGIYHELYKNLSNELGISPLKETTSLYYQIVNQWNASTDKAEEQSSQLLVAKDNALRQILSLCSGTVDGRRVPCALIEGEAGVGKTYLLDHILHYYDFSEWLVCRSFCYQSEAGTPLSPWNSIMMTLMSAVEKHHFSIPQSYLKAAASLFPALSANFDQEHTPFDLNYPQQQNYYVAQESTLLIFAAVAKQLPVLLIFEDIHWMDKNSAELLATFLRRLRDLNVTVLCTSREVHAPHIVRFLTQARRDNILECYPICRFSQEETADFVHRYLDREITPELMEQIYRTTGGNALFLVQVMRYLQEGPGLPHIPDNLDNIIGYRLSSLSLEERQVLDLISVFPDWASFDYLSSILTLDPLELMCICDQLEHRQLILESSQDGALKYSLAHEQIQTALVAQQSETTRRILHLRVAQHLESQPENQRVHLYERLVYHYKQGGNRLKVFQYRLLSLNSYTRTHYAVLPDTAQASETADVQDPFGYFRVLERELAALRASPSHRELLDYLELVLLHTKGCYCVYMGNYDQGLDALYRLIELCGTVGNTSLIILAHLQIIYYGIQIYDPQIMEESLHTGMALLDGKEPSEMLGVYLRMAGVAHMMRGSYVLARALMRQSIDTFSPFVSSSDDWHTLNIAGAYNYIGECYRLEGDFDHAFSAYDQAIIFNRSRGYYPGVAAFYTNYGVAAFQKGETGISRQLFQYAIETYRVSHGYSGLPIALSYLALFEARDGNFSLAAEYIAEALQVSDMIGSPWWRGVTLYQCWNIRLILEAGQLSAPELQRLWPQDPREHCQLCLSALHRLPPRQETREMEAALRALESDSLSS